MGMKIFSVNTDDCSIVQEDEQIPPKRFIALQQMSKCVYTFAKFDLECIYFLGMNPPHLPQSLQ